jgi:APA family basic amino acid/polyamine antiporter
VIEGKTMMKARLGSPILWGLVQAFVAAGFYFSVGIVADRAQGWTWVVYLVATLFFLLTAMSYVEGASLHQERGGATIIARYAFNELVSFIAGWAILLDYVILIALTAFTLTDYLAVFWDDLGHGALELVVAFGVLAAVTVINVRGLDPGRVGRFFFFALVDLGVQLMLLVVGLIVLFDPQVLTDPVSFGTSVSFDDVVFAFPLAVVAFTALDASSGLAGQVRISRAGLKKLMGVRVMSLSIAYIGLAIVASSTIGRASGAGGPESRIDAPLLGMLADIDENWLREGLGYVVGASASLVLFTACVGAMLGLSRLGYALAVNRQIPSVIGRLHPTYKTPVVVIGIGAVLAAALVIPEDTEFLGAIYAFGATLAFTIVHLSVLRLRRKEPDRDRPFRIPFNVAGLPVPAMLGALLSIIAFLAVLGLHGAAKFVGPAWMVFGVVLYVAYRRGSDKSITKRLTVPEDTLTREGDPSAEYGSILVPIFGTPLDDDIMQTAGRLAAESRPDEDQDGAEIEAIWVFVVPLSLPIDGRIPEADLKRARKALARAKAVGEEYDGVEVSPFTVRSRSAGQAIVREAKRRGVEAIVMPAEEPTAIRGGVLLGGHEGLRSTFVGDTTRYVINKATCRVILTAPPGERARPGAPRTGAPPEIGDPVS